MLGAKSKEKLLYRINVSRVGHLNDCVFVPVFPRNSLIKDIMFVRPYTPGETVKVIFYDNDSNPVLTKTDLRTNKLHVINLNASGTVTLQVFRESDSQPSEIEELLVFYEQSKGYA
jgi:hypothetical protein